MRAVTAVSSSFGSKLAVAAFGSSRIQAGHITRVRRESSLIMAVPFVPTFNLSTPVDKQTYDKYWEEKWLEGIEPGQMWDKGVPHPTLQDLLAKKTLHVEGARVFIPGCGRGYDPVKFVEAGAATAVGLDLSETGVTVANGWLKASALPTDVVERVKIVLGDFFTYHDPEGPFDLGYDYTFFCALHPNMRSDWAAHWHRHLRPGGELVTMMFPIRPVPEGEVASGPPWPLSEEIYREHLEKAGFACISIHKISPELNMPGREGFEYLGRWQRK